MKSRLWVLAWAGTVALGACSPTEGLRAESSLTPAISLPEGAREPELLSSTAWVSDLLLTETSLWVASDGGIERFAAPDYRSRRLFTVADGLDTQQVLRITRIRSTVTAQTASGRCVLEAERFRCVPWRSLTQPEPRVLGSFAGKRITSRAEGPGVEFVGTAGAGVWLTGKGEPRRLTPSGQLSGNHITSMVVHQDALWLGTFNHGLCRSTDARRFETVPTPFQMVNALLDTPQGLLVAANEGLFRRVASGDFERVVQLGEAGVSGLARGREAVYAVTAGALWTLPLEEGTPLGQGAVALQSPGGSTALQAVAVGDHGVLWLASEDRGAMVIDGATITVLDRSAGLPSSWGVDIATASDGSAYLATLRDGVLHLWPDGRWQTVSEVPDPWTFTLFRDRAGLCIGTQRGAALLTPTAARQLELLPDGRVHAFARYGERLLVGTQHGLASYPAATLE